MHTSTPGAAPGRLLVGGAVCLVPLVAVYLSPLHAETALIYVGLLPTLVALQRGPLVALGTAVATGAVMFLGLVLSGAPVAVTVLMAALGVAVAWSYTRGWEAAATYVATQAALAGIVAPRTSLLSGPDHPASSPLSAALVAGFALLAGLWVAGAGALLLKEIVVMPERRQWDRELRAYACTLAVLLGVATLVVMVTVPGNHAWWILLTILVSLEPDRSASVIRALHRAGGTVLGGIGAALLVVLVDERSALTLVGLAAALGSVAAFMKAPYWVFAATLTMALALLTFPVGHVLRGDLERVGYTVLAAGVVVVITAVLQRWRPLAPDPVG